MVNGEQKKQKKETTTTTTQTNLCREGEGVGISEEQGECRRSLLC
jgi:hypothetical protein